MSKQMSARFKAEGVAADGTSSDPQIQLVDVYMDTDGQLVTVTLYPFYHGGREKAPALTPVGWQQVAMHAQRFVKEANEAWARMASEG